jgi:hypothetical protein
LVCQHEYDLLLGGLTVGARSGLRNREGQDCDESRSAITAERTGF